MRHELVVRSMHCAQCASNVERYLRDQPGVESAAVDFDAGRARVEVDAGTDVGALVEAVDAMGYDASLVDPP